MTARRSWFPRRATPPRRSSSTAARSASRRARRPSPTPRTSSTPTTSTYEIVEGDTVADVVTNYLSGKCNTLTTDESQLFALRSQFPKPGEHMILPDVISKEPLGPVVRQDDMQWFNIVKWVNYALLDAEELGVGVEDDRRGAEVAEAGGEAAGRRRRATSASRSASRTPGRPTRSARSATTAKSSTATSASTPSSPSRAA